MIKKFNEIQSNSKVRQSVFPNDKRIAYQEAKKVNIKEKLLPLFVLAFLGMWIGLCYQHDSHLLNHALVASSIIVSVLFFSTAERNGDLR